MSLFQKTTMGDPVKLNNCGEYLGLGRVMDEHKVQLYGNYTGTGRIPISGEVPVPTPLVVVRFCPTLNEGRIVPLDQLAFALDYLEKVQKEARERSQEIDPDSL